MSFVLFVVPLILRFSSESYDRELIEQELTPLAELKEDPEIIHQLSQLFKKHP